MPSMVSHRLWYFRVLSAHRAENSPDGLRIGITPSEIPPSLPVSSILMGASHLNSFQGSLVAIYPGWFGRGTTLSDRGLGIKSSVFPSQDLVGKVTNCLGNPASDQWLRAWRVTVSSHLAWPLVRELHNTQLFRLLILRLSANVKSWCWGPVYLFTFTWLQSSRF